MIRRTIREWETIGYGVGDTEIPHALADRIASVAQQSSLADRTGGGVLDHGRRGLKAQGVVGVLAVPGCQLEILPKIEGAGEAGPSDAMLRRRLIGMIAAVHDLKVDAVASAAMDWQRDTILELLIGLFADRLADTLRRGLPRQYRNEADDLPVLRGRLDITRQMSVLIASPDKLACIYDTLTPDIELNQVMAATVRRLLTLSQSPINQRKLRELGGLYGGVASIPVRQLGWDRIRLDRTNQRWADHLAFARLFLGGQYQTTAAGGGMGHALLFDMAMLFEGYVARIATQALADTSLRAIAQGGLRHCLHDSAGGLFQTRPDLLIRQGSRILAAVDTKWKRLAPLADDRKQGVSQADVYQLMAYAQIYDCPHVILLYPHHAGLTVGPYHRRYCIKEPQSAQTLSISTLDLTAARPEQARLFRQLLWQVIRETGVASADGLSGVEPTMVGLN